MKTESKKKRFFKNVFALLIILAVGFVAFRNYQPPAVTVKNVDLPKLNGMKPFTDSSYIVDKDVIKVAFEIDPSATEKVIVADIIEIYRWGRSGFAEAKCGEDYPKEMCRWGSVSIAVIVGQRQISLDKGTVRVPMAIYYSWLDQIQIDHLLAMKPPTTLKELIGFHDAVSKATKSTGGMGVFFENPVRFEGWPAFTAFVRANGVFAP